jgi:hypothetical protein
MIVIDSGSSLMTSPTTGIGPPPRFAGLSTSGEPYKLQEALVVPHWKTTMENEYNALLRNMEIAPPPEI